MRAACFQSIENVTTQSIADPLIEVPTDAIVEVEVAGLCGSDLHPYFGREIGIEPGTVMGHEFVGRIVEIGSEVNNLSIGDRVCSPFTTSCGTCFYCNRGLSSRCTAGQLFGWRERGQGLHGGQSEQVRVPLADGTLVRVPDWMDCDTALLLGDNLCTGYFGASMAIDRDSIDDDVYAVVGCGTVGLLAIASLRRMGATRIVAIDPCESRLRIAEQLGSNVYADGDQADSAIRKMTNGRGADGVIELVGLPQAQSVAYQVIRPGGMMSVIGCHCSPHFSFSPAQAYDKNLTYRTGRCPARSLMNTIPDLIHDQPIDLSWCITHRFSIDDAAQAYQVFSGRKEGCIKAVFQF